MVSETAVAPATHDLAVLPTTETGMARRIEEALDVGRFPRKDFTDAQRANLIRLALYYQLDPLSGEIMPYQGVPYITIEGRRRLDRRAHHHVSMSIKPMDADSYRAYVEMGFFGKGDVAVLGRFTDVDTGVTVETWGRVLASELDGNAHLPVVKWSAEQAAVRCERRGRRMLYGPVTPPPVGCRMVEDCDSGDVDVAAVVNPETGEIALGEAAPNGDGRRRSRQASSPQCPRHQMPLLKHPEDPTTLAHPLPGGGWCYGVDIAGEGEALLDSEAGPSASGRMFDVPATRSEH